MTKYLPWVLVILLGAGLVYTLFAQASGSAIGTIDLGRIVDESPLAQELNRKLNQRYEELVAELEAAAAAEEEETNQGTTDGEMTEDQTDGHEVNQQQASREDAAARAEQERQAYSEYLSYRQELEVQLQQEVDQAVRQVAQDQRLKSVVDKDVVRYGGKDITDDVIARLK